MRTGNHIFIIIVLTLLICTIDLSAQFNFNRIYGGSGGEQAYAVRQTYDGGYVFTGYTTSYGAGYNDIWLVKLAPNGDTLWTKTYGFDWVEEAYAIKQMPDSGFIILGKSTTASNGLYNDFWLLKTDRMGDTLWTKFYGDLWEQETPSEVIQSSDGGFILIGVDTDNHISNGSIWMIKTDSAGDSMWTKKFGGPYGEGASCLIQTSDGGYLIGGSMAMSSGLSDNDLLLIKTTAVGEVSWMRTYGKRNSDGAGSLLETEDGGFLIAGTTDQYYYGFSYDVWLFKVSSSGDSLWSKYYGGYENESATAIHPSEDGGYFISANVSSSYRANDGQLLIKTDSQGDTLWTRRFGGEINDWASDGFPTMDGGFILSGYTDSFGALSRDAWIIKTDDMGYVADLRSNKNANPQQFQLYQNYPNPFNPTTMIYYQLPQTIDVELSIYNLLGQRVATLVKEKKSAGYHQVEWDATWYSSGVYYYRIEAGDFQDVKRMILLR
jgi:hypothetical protein